MTVRVKEEIAAYGIQVAKGERKGERGHVLTLDKMVGERGHVLTLDKMVAHFVKSQDVTPWEP